MPIFEYKCRECSNSFEMLVRGSTTVACPSCRSTSLEKQLSVFAASVKTPFAAAGASSMSLESCGTCGDPRGPGACSMD